jgi:glutathione synthase/RimK-type ligase-like ATP-grasp enzyme
MELRIATCRPLPEPDPDEDLLLEALRHRGVQARMVAWDDRQEDWDAPVPTLLRSTWDYHHRLETFLAWTQRVAQAAPLWNPAEIATWNGHKFYLRELLHEGCAIVPTAFVSQDSPRTLRDVMGEHDWQEVVVKPAVSAASFGTLRVGPDDVAAGEAHLATLLEHRDVLVQQYADAVETSGERALVWIDGEFTHAVRKSPRFSGQDESVGEALAVAPDEEELGLAALERFEDELLYARVDVVRDAEERPMIMELELIEPSLFLMQYPPALERLADGVASRLER